MYDKDRDFPQYRKLNGRKVYYRIHSLKEFTELQFLGSSPQIFHVKAEQYPEMVRIQDMLTCELSYVQMEENEISLFNELNTNEI